MARFLPFAAGLVLFALVVAGCGKPGDFSLEKTRSCLEDAGARITPPTGDFVASTATVGAFRAHLHPGPKGNFVTLSFGADAKEAEDTGLGYQRFHGRNIGLSDILYLDRNVTMLWRQHPTDAESKLVTDCLR